MSRALRFCLRRMTALLLSVFRALLSRPKLAVIVFSAISAFMVVQLPKITAELRVYDIVDPKFPATAQLRDMKSKFAEQNSILLLFARDDGTAITSEQACKIRDWLANLEDDNSGVSAEISGILNPFLLNKPRLAKNHVEWTPLIALDHCDSTPMPVKPLLDSPWQGLLTDPAGRDLAAQVNFRDTVGGSRYGKFDPTPIGALWKNLETGLLTRTPGLHAYLGGRASFQWYYQKALQHDVLINFLVLGLLMLFFRYFYGTWKSGFLLLLIILCAATFIFGAMSLAGSPVDYLSNGLFLMMCVAAVEDFVFISDEQLVRADPKGDVGWRRSVRSLLLPGLFTSLTTFVGFLSLETADLGIIRRFGFWAGWAALCEWGITFYALPVFLKAFRVRAPWVDPRRAKLRGVFESSSRFAFPKAGVAVAGLLFLAGLWGFAHLNINDSPRGNFLKTHMQHRTYDYTRATRGWEGPLFVVFPDAHREEPNQAALRAIALDSNVARIENPYEITKWFLGGLPEEHRRWIQAELSLSKTYRGYFSRVDSARATVYLKSLDLSDLNSSIARIRLACKVAGCYPAGEGVVYADYSNRVVDTLFKSLLSSLVLVGLILLGLTFALGSNVKLGLLFSVFWSPVLVVGGLAFFEVPMNFTTSMFASVLVGLTGDNAVQYLFASRRGDLRTGIRKRSRASVQVTAIAATASLFFLGLTLVPLKLLGVLLFCGFVVSLAGDLWMLNGIAGFERVDGIKGDSKWRQ